MKILVPLKNTENIKSYSIAGADEMYIGFYDEEWNEILGNYVDLNRMSALKNKANELTINEIADAVRLVHQNGKKCYITLNANVYSDKQMPFLNSYISKLGQYRVDGVIFSSPQLIPLILKHNLEPVASTMCGIYNTDAVKYYYSAGVKRMILPRELSLSEISEIVTAYPQIHFEVFLMRNGCVFSDSNCLCIHKKTFGGICHTLREAQYEIHMADPSFVNLYEFQHNHLLYSNGLMKNACGLCAIYQLIQMGVYSGKIVGRVDRSSGILEDIRVVKHNVEIALSSKSEEEYLKNMVIPSRRQATCGLSCYYPEVRF